MRKLGLKCWNFVYSSRLLINLTVYFYSKRLKQSLSCFSLLISTVRDHEYWTLRRLENNLIDAWDRSRKLYFLNVKIFSKIKARNRIRIKSKCSGFYLTSNTTHFKHFFLPFYSVIIHTIIFCSILQIKGAANFTKTNHRQTTETRQTIGFSWTIINIFKSLTFSLVSLQSHHLNCKVSIPKDGQHSLKIFLKQKSHCNFIFYFSACLCTNREYQSKWIQEASCL